MHYHDKALPPTADWAHYRKTVTTRMTPVVGPFTVTTREGDYSLPVGWLGFIALDVEGYPYPIEAEVHQRSYVEVAE